MKKLPKILLIQPFSYSKFFFVPVILVMFPAFIWSQQQDIATVWNRGIAAYEVYGEYNKAIIDFSEVIRRNPRFGEAHFRLALVLLRIKNYDAALEYFAKAVQLEPTEVFQYNLYTRINKQELARDSAFIRGCLNFSAKIYERASKDFEQSIIAATTKPGQFDWEFVTFAKYYKAQALIFFGKKREGCQECENLAMQTLDRRAKKTVLSFCKTILPLTLDTLFPMHKHFYPCDKDDSAVVPLKGDIFLKGFDSVIVIISKNNVPYQRLSNRLHYQRGLARFTFQPKIYAELSEYSLTLSIKNKTKDTVLLRRDGIICGDVYYITGQSNAYLGSIQSNETDNFCRTAITTASGIVWMNTELSNRINLPGRVGGIAATIQQEIVRNYKKPVCFINSAVAATSIEKHLPDEQSPLADNYYTPALRKICDAGLQKAIKGIIWYQGESNTEHLYEQRFEYLTQLWSKDFSGLRRIYVAQLRPCDCNNNLRHDRLRDVQRQLSQKIRGVEVFTTNAVSGYDGCHFNDEGYSTLGKQLFRLIARDFYRSADTLHISSPQIQKISYTNSEKNEIALVFSPENSEITQTSDSIIIDGKQHRLSDYFFATVIDTANHARFERAFSSVRTKNNIVYLTLKKNETVMDVSYLPDAYYANTQQVYQGPWLINNRRIGALSFYKFPVQQFK